MTSDDDDRGSANADAQICRLIFGEQLDERQAAAMAAAAHRNFSKRILQRRRVDNSSERPARRRVSIGQRFQKFHRHRAPPWPNLFLSPPPPRPPPVASARTRSLAHLHAAAAIAAFVAARAPPLSRRHSPRSLASR